MDLFFYLTLFLFILLFGAFDNGIDFDFFARLIVGKSFFETGTLFNNDFYSYGTTHNFIDHEWGSSLVFYLIQNNFNDIGLYILKTLLIFFTFFIIIQTIRLEKKDSKLNFLFFFFAIQSISYNIFATIRCQSFSFLFFALYLYILRYSQLKKNYRILWTLPILNIIWANMHGGFVLGLLLIFIFIIGDFLNNNQTKFAKYLSLTFVLTLLTTLINPYGIDYLIYIFEAFKLNRIHITEWHSAFFDKNYIHLMVKFKLFFISTMILFIYSIIKNIKLENFKNWYDKIDKIKYITLIVMTILALKALRCHVFFTLCVISYCYNDFYNIFNKKLPKRLDDIKEVIIFLIITISAICHIKTFNFENTVSNSNYPIKCVEFIKENNLKGNIFAMFHTGSYVAYKLYPDNFVFMDGRYEEVYDNELINKMAKFYLGKNVDEFLKEFHNDILILDKKYEIARIIEKNRNWQKIYEDKYHKLFINKKYNKTSFKMPQEDKHYYNQTKFITNINWLK